MKLKSVDQPKIFYQVAHRLIVLQKEPFSIEALLKQYYKKCGSNINLDYAKKVVLEPLSLSQNTNESVSSSKTTALLVNDVRALFFNIVLVNKVEKEK